MLAEGGLEISAGKMSNLWSGAPVMIRLADLDVICATLSCEPNELLVPEPNAVAKPKTAAGDESQSRVVVGEEGRTRIRPQVTRGRSLPPT